MQGKEKRAPRQPNYKKILIEVSLKLTISSLFRYSAQSIIKLITLQNQLKWKLPS